MGIWGCPKSVHLKQMRPPWRCQRARTNSYLASRELYSTDTGRDGTNWLRDRPDVLSSVAGGRHLLSLYHIRLVQLEHQWGCWRRGTVPASTNVASKQVAAQRAACMILRRLMTSIHQILFLSAHQEIFCCSTRGCHVVFATVKPVGKKREETRNSAAVCLEDHKQPDSGYAGLPARGSGYGVVKIDARFRPRCC